MGKIIALANQKGGVGKTTTSINLAAGLAYLNKRILLVDFDPQGNATQGLGYRVGLGDPTVYDAILNDEVNISECIRTLQKPPLDILPSNINLAGADLQLAKIEEGRESYLKNALADIENRYDYIIIDCPPSLGLITANALTLADSFIVPIQCEYYALEGLSQLMSTVRRIKRQYNYSIELEGVLLTMYDGRLNLTQQVVEEVKKFFPGKVFGTVVNHGVRLSEAPSFGMPVIYYDKNCKGSVAYTELAKEIIAKERR